MTRDRLPRLNLNRLGRTDQQVAGPGPGFLDNQRYALNQNGSGGICDLSLIHI